MAEDPGLCGSNADARIAKIRVEGPGCVSRGMSGFDKILENHWHEMCNDNIAWLKCVPQKRPAVRIPIWHFVSILNADKIIEASRALGS